MIPPTKPLAHRDDDAIAQAADAPMTGDQADLLRSLCEDAGEPFNANLTEAEALQRIAELTDSLNTDQNL
ncbi:Protein of unknown function [Loktanella atrilutea]|uniref:DUF3072 domain-containing protein n=1 Tax=Loktanella atrilutea TaxID=366533 RepID=A0A1M5AYD0_LOKAT|nr:DUF3072 domain-containing protein [Loktanella atrilutea]SHF35219.1 Protein of unknown function [Loktanella atrilutea]